ncbi:MAG: molybdopterin converting factor subunit 1 [Rhodospirillales bacterium]|nr:molybdopterin converting factor subunit 1 [Rhodospirillales bacterium]
MKIMYFAWVREMTGKPEENIELPEGLATVHQLVAWLKLQDDVYQRAFADESMIRVAVNQEYVSGDGPISNDDEVAFFPPVTGG